MPRNAENHHHDGEQCQDTGDQEPKLADVGLIVPPLTKLA